MLRNIFCMKCVRLDSELNFYGITGLIEICILSTNSMSVLGTFNQLTARSRVVLMFYVRYKSTVKRSALEVDDGEVRQSSTYERKASIGSNVLHTVHVPLSHDFWGGFRKKCHVTVSRPRGILSGGLVYSSVGTVGMTWWNQRLST